MFERPHHQRIALVLQSLDIDFLVSGVPGYRDLRQSLTGTAGSATIGQGGRILSSYPYSH
jgi:hypothetical protein